MFCRHQTIRQNYKHMKKFTAILMLMCLVAASAFAQHTISGTIIDPDTDEGVMQATVALLKKDSTFVKGVISDTNGHFSVSAPSNGNYILKITSVAYKPLFKPVTIADGKNVALGKVNLVPDAIMLKEAVATGQAARVVVKADTFEYNAAAYHTPEGSVVEELVKRLPGAQIDDDGKITMNGKQVKKILVDGKEFMTGDTETALKNLPTSIIDKVRSFDQKSDLARITGIDDGEEETVLDFGIKRGMNRGTMGNFDLAIGTKQRYAERGMGSYMQDDISIMGFGSANNVGDMGFGGGRGGWRGGNNGLNATKMLGVNINYEKKDLIKIDGSVRWNHSDGDSWSRSSAENFYGEKSTFTNSLSSAFSRGNAWNAQMRLEWTPDSMTNVMFRPRFSYQTNDRANNGTKAEFSDDPYNYVDNPLSDADMKKLTDDNLLINKTLNTGLTYTSNTNAGGMLQYNRRLGKAGRNVTLRVDGNYSKGESTSATLQDVTIYQALTDSTYQTNRYELTPTTNYNYSARATYSEPIAKRMYLQGSYTFKYSKQKSDRSSYNYSNYFFSKDAFGLHDFRNWPSFIGMLDGYPDLSRYYDEDQSKYSEYDTYTNQFDLQLRKIGEKWNYTVGLMLQPQSTELTYKYNGLDTIVNRSVFNFAPTLDLRYKISAVSQLRAEYRVNNSQPSMTDLIDVVNDADKLNIHRGNPNLKPSFTHNFSLFYNGFSSFHTQSWMARVNFSVTQNSVSSMVRRFDEPTVFEGYSYLKSAKLTRPENINGNWNAFGMIMYNASIDSTGIWNINTFTNVNYNNRVSYYSEGGAESVKNTTKTTGIGERLGFSYRTSWIEIEPNGRINYNHTRNLLQPKNNLDTYDFGYGLDITITAPWGTGFSTDAHMNSRRGYNDQSMNTNEFVWNAQISQSFLKGRPLTVSLQFYDLLHNQSNISRSITAMQRSDTEYNSINSYAMLHVIYRFNNFGGKAARQGMGGPGPNFNDPRFSRGGAPGGRPGGFGGGGFGGGRPRF